MGFTFKFELFMIYYKLSRCFDKRNDFTSALKYIGKCIEVIPNVKFTLLFLLIICVKKDKIKFAN